ncbi:6886_t:CDS:2, partial [Ambispora gerdemannii]
MEDNHNHDFSEEFDESFDDEITTTGEIETPYDNYSEDEDIISDIDPAKSTPHYHVQRAEEVMRQVKYVASETGWKKVLSHKSGVSVWSKPGINKNDKSPILKGEGVIQGFTPQTIFSVIGDRGLWDDWYTDGNLIENLNDTTSLTYMVIQALAGTKARDLSLVEKIECTSTGVIYFASTSVETPKVPRVSNRIRAHIKLNGWILDPVSINPPATKVTYILQTDIKGWVPFFVSKKYLARRPLVINVIDQYLQRNGPPPIAAARSTPPPSRKPSRKPSQTNLSSSRPATIVNGGSVRSKISFMEDSEGNLILNGSIHTPNGSTHVDDVSVSEPSSPYSTYSHKRMQNKSNGSIPSALSNQSSSSSSIKQFSIPTQQQSSSPVPTLQISSKSSSPVPALQISPRSSSPVPALQISPRPSSSLPRSPSPSDQSSPRSPKLAQMFQNRYSIIQHRHSDPLYKALTTLKSYAESLDGWELYTENKGVKIYMKEIPGKSMPIMRGEATITGGWTAEDLLATILDPSCRKLWDDRLEESVIVEYLTATVATTERDLFSGVIYNASCSVVDPAIPETSKHVRAQLDLAGWVLRPQFDSAGYTTAVDVIYIVDIDIKLQSIPSAILKTISIGTPLCVAKLDEVIQKNGYPPYVRNINGKHSKVTSSAFNQKILKYELTLSDLNPGAITEIRVSRKMYWNGFDITIKPAGSKVEILPNNTEVVRITVPEKADYRSLDIILTKQTAKEAQLTLNGTQNIPIASISNKNDLQEQPQIASPRARPAGKKRELTISPTRESTIFPTRESTIFPTRESTIFPTRESTIFPTRESTIFPTRESTIFPTRESTIFPTREPTISPTREPIISPTRESIISPTRESTIFPTRESTILPTRESTILPTRESTILPTRESTISPTRALITSKTCVKPPPLEASSNQNQIKAANPGPPPITISSSNFVNIDNSPPNPLIWYPKKSGGKSNDTEKTPAVRDEIVLSDTLRFNSHQ